MSEDQSPAASGGGSLRRIREASDAVEKSTSAVIVEKVRERWHFVVAIVVLAVASVLLSRVDGGMSMDATIFAGLTALLLVYFVLTVRSDVKME